MGAFGAGGMFNPMWMGGKGMFQVPDWWQAASADGKGEGTGMFPQMWPGWPGVAADGSRNGRPRESEDRRKSSRRDRSGDRSRERRDRSRSDRGKSVDYLRLPRLIMGRVIGKQGATINGIREASGARIDAEDKNDDQCEFKIQGSPEAVERAKSMILEVVEKSRAEGGGAGGGAGGSSGPGLGGTETSGTGTSDTMDFPVSLMGGIIGTRGSKISEVRQQSGARVQVEKGDGRCKVTISGSPEQVDRAKELVRALAEDEMGLENVRGSGSSSRNDSWSNTGTSLGGNTVSNSLEFPVSATGRIIGSRGAQISEVRQNSGAKVSVEKMEDRDCCKVQITGTPEQVDRARKMVMALADEGQGVRRAEANDLMEVPLSVVGRVIGKGGDTIQRLQRESGARLDVNTNEGDPCVVRISGSRDACSRARFLIAEVLNAVEVLDRGNQFSANDRTSSSTQSGQRDQGSGYWGSESSAPWGPLAGFAGPGAMPPYGGLPPPGDGNGSQWSSSAWGGMQMQGMWGYPPAGGWDYIPGERSERREHDGSARERPSYAEEPRKRKEIDLDEL